MEIVPTVTTTDIAAFDAFFSRLIPYCTTFQIDIQDGIFVPNTTFTADDVVQFLQKLPPERLSVYKSATFDFHLMVQDYTSSLAAIHEIQKFVPVRYIFVHQNFPPIIKLKIENWNLEFNRVCPTLNPEDPPITPGGMFLGKPLINSPAIQVMTIHPGPQGQAFIPGQLERVNALRIEGYKGKVVVDGGIHLQSIQHILSLPATYHPDIFCVGSYLSRAPDQEIKARMETLKSLVAS
jgi:pentose-5-phosphate-3-epimerase